MLQRFLLFWLLLLCAIAFVWPDVPESPEESQQTVEPAETDVAEPKEVEVPASEVESPAEVASESLLGRINPFVASSPGLKYLFAATMFVIGALLPPEEVEGVLMRWPTVLGGTAIQYCSMPLLAYSIGHAFGFEGDLLRGVILVGCVPGAMASNVLTQAAKGNVSYSVSLTTSATLLSPAIVPLVLYFAVNVSLPPDERIKLVYDSFQLLILQVALPVVSGFVAARRLGSLEMHFSRWGATYANLSILWIIAVIVHLKRDSLHELSPLLLVALLAINVAGYIAGYFGGATMRLDESKRRALTLEVGMQNAGLGAVMATQLFPQSITALPPVLYMVGCMLTGAGAAQLWSRIPLDQPEVDPAAD